jgi:hypothetical protein
MMESIEVTIDKSGQVKVEVNGCSGKSCSDLTKGIEQALGQVTADEQKPEYFRHGQERQAKR